MLSAYPLKHCSKDFINVIFSPQTNSIICITPILKMRKLRPMEVQYLPKSAEQVLVHFSGPVFPIRKIWELEIIPKISSSPDVIRVCDFMDHNRVTGTCHHERALTDVYTLKPQVTYTDPRSQMTSRTQKDPQTGTYKPTQTPGPCLHINTHVRNKTHV